MTDQYGSDHEGHDVSPEHEQGGEAESWHDEQPVNEPPVDDFADPESHTEESATVSEEAEAAPELEEETEVPSSGRKKLLLPLAAGIGGLLFLGGMMYLQFGGHSATSATPLPIAVAQNPKLPTNDNGSAPVEDAAPTTALAPVPEITSAPTTALPTNSGIATPIAQANPSPAAANVPAAQPAQTTPAVIAPSNMVQNLAPPAIPAPSANETLEARLTTLAARVDNLQKSLDQTAQQLGQISNMVAANQAAPPAGSTPAVEDRLNKIEQQMLELQHDEQTKAASAPASGAAAEPPSAEEGVETKSAALETPAPLTKPAVKSAVKHSTSHTTVAHHLKHKRTKVAAHKKSHAKVASSHVTHWVLRAATPDEAWVATDAYSPDLHHVAIGDILPGIGRVKAIKQTGDNWEIVGSAGIVK